MIIHIANTGANPRYDLPDKAPESYSKIC
jgi:hypothetical protein